MIKNLIILSLALIPFSLAAQTKSPYKTYYDKEQQHIDEAYSIINGNKNIIDGPYTKYYYSGNKEIIGQFIDGNKTGVFTSYYNNGKIKQTLEFVAGQKNGPVKIFTETGNVLQEGRFKDNQLEGILKLYYKTGELKSTTEFVNGQPEGEIIEYFKNGKACQRTIRYRSHKC